MRQKRFLSLFLLSFFCLFQLAAQQQELQPLPIDPQVRYGKLPNGLTYYIRHNEQPKERADFYIAQNVGSMLEEENQRGLAHFLEHMAFNGSKNFPDKGMDEFTQSIGMRMGENFNAYTSFDETVYMIMNAPVTRESVVDSCLLILHDWSGFITLADSAIDKERGVIREEWRTRQDAQARIWEQQLPKIYPDSRYAHRMPIGTIDVIDNFKPDELRDYYHKWYRPDLQAIIIVGDINVDQVETAVKRIFADIPAPVNAAPRPLFEVPDNDMPLISVATDKEASNTILSISYKHDKMPQDMYGTIAGLVKDYIQSVAATMMNERFNEMVQKANPPFVAAQASDGDFMISKTKGAWSVAALVKDNEVDSAMNALVTETQRVKQFGFTPSEYDRARINVLKQYESLYNDRDKQRNIHQGIRTPLYRRRLHPRNRNGIRPDRPGCTGCTGRTGQQVYPGYDRRYKHRDQPDRSGKGRPLLSYRRRTAPRLYESTADPCRTLPGDLIGRTVDPLIAGTRQDHGKQGRSALRRYRPDIEQRHQSRVETHGLQKG